MQDGGRDAARGFQYQYRRTLEAMVKVIDDLTVVSVRVEGEPGESGANAVDFDVVESGGRRRVAAQVKSRAAGVRMGAAEAFRELARLAGTGEAARYELLTNAVPGPGARELSEALARGGDVDDLRTALQRILANADLRLRELAQLAAEHPQRLTRLRLSFDSRDAADLTDDLRERLRRYRNSARQGLGEETAGLLSGYLIGEIFERAADARRAVYTMDQFRADVLIEGQHLARLRGGRDWGVVVGPMPAVPDISRPALLQRIVAAFGDRSQPGVRRVALVGPSGIGKTSLAAAYVADRADSYELIFWVDADNEASLLESFRSVLRALRGPQALAGYAETVHQLRTDVHSDLSSLVGHWIMIFDNAQGPRHIEPWIPPLGHGDILISCIDAAARYGTAEVIDVVPMQHHEAVALLARRLGVEHHADASQVAPLARLATELGCWPLALELAAGYLDSCGIDLERIDYYLDKLKVRSLSDPSSLPPSYPLTLAAAINLCLESLAERAVAKRGDGAPVLALGLMKSSAYLTARLIPVQLLAASVLIRDSLDPLHAGPVGVDPAMFNLAEEVRELRRFSLAAADALLPALDAEAEPDFRQTITVNSVVQELMRAHLDHDPWTPALLERLAFHLDRWLVAAMDLGQLSRALVMYTHAETLVSHLRRLGIATNRTGLLRGNLAAAYRAQGDFDRAIDLLREEIEDLLSSESPNQVVLAQANLVLADILLDNSVTAGGSTDIDAVVHHLDHVLDYAGRVAAAHPGTAVKLAYHAHVALDRPGANRLVHPELARLRAAFADLLASLPETPFSYALAAIIRSSQLLDANESTLAEQTLRQVLQSDVVLGSAELEARRLLIEALIDQQQWHQAHGELTQLMERFGDAPMHLPVVSQLVHNAGLRCALHILLQAQAAAAQLLATLLDWPMTTAAARRDTPGRRGRVRLLEAIRWLAEGSYQQAEAALRQLGPANLNDGNPSQTSGWVEIWRIAQLVLLRAASHSAHQQDVNHGLDGHGPATA